jgi:hypothetical protein
VELVHFEVKTTQETTEFQVSKTLTWNSVILASFLLRNVQVPRRNSDSHLVFRDPTQLRAKKTYLEEVSVLEPGIL